MTNLAARGEGERRRKPYFRIRPDGRKVRFMAAADGYAMVRIPACMPFVVPINEWNSWEDPTGDDR